MKVFAKGCLVFLLSISLILQGCSAVHDISYKKGRLLKTEHVAKVEKTRGWAIELLSPTSVKILDHIEYANKIIEKYEKIEVKKVYTLPAGAFMNLPFNEFPGVCSPQDENYDKRCWLTWEQSIIPNDYIMEERYNDVTHAYAPVTAGDVGVSVYANNSSATTDILVPKNKYQKTATSPRIDKPGKKTKKAKKKQTASKQPDETEYAPSVALFDSSPGGMIVFESRIPLAADGTAFLDLLPIADKLHSDGDAKVTYRYGNIEESSILPRSDVKRALATRTPPFLTIDRKVSFVGALQGGTLEGEQNGKVLVTISNKGKGNAFGVKLAVSGSYPGVTLPSTIIVGDIPPGSSKEVAIPVEAVLNVQSGQLALSFQAKEQYGKDSVPLKMQPAIVIRQLEKPQLEIVSITSNDTGSLASGNGNGVAENGETVELLVKVKNNGEGPSKGVVLRFSDLPQGVNPVAASVQLGNIPPGGTKEGALALHLPKLFRSTKEELPIYVSVADARPIGKTGRKKLALPYRFNEPIIRIADMEIFDGDPETSSIGNRNHLMNQGEQVEVRAYVENAGTMAAEDVTVTLKTDRPTNQVTVSPSSVYLGKIGPGIKRLAAVFTVDVPGSVAPGPIKMDVTATQKDFETQYASFRRTVYDADTVFAQVDVGSTSLGLQKTKTGISTVSTNIDEVPYIADFRRPNAHALLIGVGKYKRSSVHPLPFAVSDARAVRSYLVNLGGIPPENVTMLTDEDATLSGIQEQFEKLTRKTKADSDVFIFFSGHGVPELEQKAPYLLPYDGNPNSIRSTGFAVSEMKQIVNTLPTKKVLIAMDACFTGEGRSVVAEGTRGVAWVDEEKTQTSAVVINASNEKQASWDWPEKAHGIFTYYFLKGLRGAATGGKGDGYVYADELFDYVAREVPATALEKHGVKQSPVKQGSGKDFRLTKRIQ